MNTLKSNTPSVDESRPWYKEPWLWFVLAPLITVVMVSAVTVTIAVSGADKVVDGPYKKRGRMLHIEPTATPPKSSTEDNRL